MKKEEYDQHILRLISQIFVDIFNGSNLWKLPNAHAALINFTGREMKLLLADEKKYDAEKLERQPQFSPDALSQFAIQLILHSLQIGRYVNRIRIASGRQEIDWYSRVIEEDQNERSRTQL